MRLITLLRGYCKDESGMVFGFSALILPVILLLGTLIIQSGQLYVRQAELQFLARQAANSALLPVAEAIEAQALANWNMLCSVEGPPSICRSTQWTDFLTEPERNRLLEDDLTYHLVQAEIERFIRLSDSAKTLQAAFVSVDFPLLNIDGRASLKLKVSEPQVWWLGNVFSAENYHLEAESLSYLNLKL